LVQRLGLFSFVHGLDDGIFLADGLFPILRVSSRLLLFASYVADADSLSF
jgi:hypothetical protein